jgi:two-component system, sporulation sensor kinase A
VFTKRGIMLLYIIFSVIWIILTDILVHFFGFNGYIRLTIEIGKGIIFVAVSSVFLYMMMKRKEQLKKVTEDEQQLSTLINSMPDFVCFKDSQGRWLRVNDFGRKLYKLENVDYFGKTDKELGEVVPFFRDALNHCMITDEEAWKAGKLSRSEESFVTSEGEMKTFDVIKVPLFYENGERKGLLTIGRDITQQKLAESLLLKKEKLSVLGELAAGIAHEVRNPLTSIKGFIQVMRETKRVEESYIQIVLEELERINQIISELLILGKPQSHYYKPFPLNDAVSYVMNLIGHEAMLNNISITLNDSSSRPLIYGDKNQLIQVFINILKNSIEAMPQGGSIDIVINEKGNAIKICIKDTGVGIPKERLTKIGEPFFTLKEKGMGLGLTTSTKIIQEHKGTLKIDSEVGKGTTVYITLPRYKSERAHCQSE